MRKLIVGDFWNHVWGGVGCVGGSVAVVATGAATVPACAATLGAGCVGGGALILYEVDQTQASCRQLWSGEQVQSLGSQGLEYTTGSSLAGMAYDLLGLAHVARKGGAKLYGLMAQLRAAGKLGDMVDLARNAGNLSDLLKSGSIANDDLVDLLNRGKLTPADFAAANRPLPAGYIGGNVSKVAKAARLTPEIAKKLKAAGLDPSEVVIHAGDPDKVVVIGRNMQRAVEPAADAFGIEKAASTFTPTDDAWKALKRYGRQFPDNAGLVPDELLQNTDAFTENLSWIQNAVDNGYTIIDVGYQGNHTTSAFYEMERAVVNRAFGE